MPEEPNVVLVSNRGPVSFVETPQGYETTRGAGGLAGALDPVVRRLGDRARWIAAAVSETDRKAVAAGAADDLSAQVGYSVQLIDLDPDVYSRYYDVVSNRMLWFAHHCLWEELNVEGFGPAQLAAWSDAYEPVNETFARTASKVAPEGALILFQDYHLSLAPRQLRSLREDVLISHFTHSSFCGPRGLERLPRPIPQKVIEGMLGADLVGFHVARWAEGFFESCALIGAHVDRSAGLVTSNGRRTWVRTYPIPIDPSALEERRAQATAQEWVRRFNGMRVSDLIVRADRTEPSKNIVRGFKAWERLLDRRPDLRDKVRFIACLYPSRESMPEYRRYSDEVEETVRAINARYPRSIDLFLEDDYDRTLGALSVYDVLLVNPIMDGMNLVAKEGPALNTQSGVLVLSTGAGAWHELGSDAVVISDPLDVEGTADALERALALPREERSRRAAALAAVTRSNTPDDWIDSQIEDLIAVGDEGQPRTPPPEV